MVKRPEFQRRIAVAPVRASAHRRRQTAVVNVSGAVFQRRVGIDDRILAVAGCADIVVVNLTGDVE